MQTLDIISVNIWQMLISLLNLVILYLLVKHFLYRPVKKMLATRQSHIDEAYAEAESAKGQALSDKKAYEEKLAGARHEADSLLQSAVEAARSRENEIVNEAKDKAKEILRRSEEDARLETKKAEQQMKEEIVALSTQIAEKMLKREIKAEDHKDIIDSVIEKIGEDHEGTE